VVKHDAGLRVGYWRSVSHFQNAFANEGFIDELAAAAKADPVAYRMSLIGKSPRFQNVLKLASEKAGWSSQAPAGRSRGVALMEGYDTYMAMVAEISMKDGEPVVGRLLNRDTFTVQLIDEQERLVSLVKADLREYGLVRRTGMPSYQGKLTNEEVADLLAYLLTLKGM